MAIKMKLEQEEIEHSLKLLFKSSIFIFVAIFISKLLTYFLRLIIARHFGPETYGLFSLGIMILTWMVSFSSLGLLGGALNFMSFYKGKNDIKRVRYILKICSIVLFFSTVLSAILLYFLSSFISISIFHNPELIIFLKIFSFLIPVYVFLYLFLEAVQAFERIGVYTFLLDFLTTFLQLIFLILFIFLGLKSNAIIFSYAIGITTVLVICFLYCKYKIPEIFGDSNLDKKSKEELNKKLYFYSWPLIFSSIISGLLPYIDSFAIGYFKSAYDVGIYNAAVPIAGLLFFAPNLFIRLFYPIIVKEFSRKNFEVIRELTKQIEKWILIVNLPVFFIMIIFPGAFINILFGSNFLSATTSLRFLLIGSFFYSMAFILSCILLMAEKTKFLLYDMMFVCILNILLDIVLVPPYGIAGAAFATMICNFVLCMIYFVQVWNYNSIIPLRRKMYKVFLSALLPIALLLIIKSFITYNIFNLVLLSIFYGLFYILLIFLTKSLDKNDIMILDSIKNKIFKK